MHAILNCKLKLHYNLAYAFPIKYYSINDLHLTIQKMFQSINISNEMIKEHAVKYKNTA